MRLREIRGALSLLPLIVFIGPSSVFSQQQFDPLEQFNANGFDQNRDYFSGLPAEHIDPMTGNLILTFTDLVLPGNAGFDLKIQRVYNSKIYRNFHSMGDTLGEDSPAGVGWSIHLGRVLDPEGSPVIEMSDGSRHPAYRHIDGTGRFITKEYWVYNKNLSVPTLSLTNGVVYRFGAHIAGVRHVTEIVDSFGNRIVVTYGNAASGEPADGIKTITQYLSSTRVVTFSYETGVARKNLKTITYNGEKTYTWTYVHTTVPVQGPLHSLLKEVKPPIGPSWLYQYNESTSPRYELTRATAPGGGYTNYSYSTVAFYNPGSVQILNSRAVTGKSIAGYDIAAGSWSFSYAQGSNKDQSTFTTPCGTIKYEFLGIGNQTFQVEAWQVGLQKSKQILSGAIVLEQEVFTWKKGAAISTDPFITGLRTDADTWVPLLEERVVTREGQTFRTTNTYGTGNFNDFGRPNHVVQDGDRTRTTDYTFDYNFTSSLYLKDRIASEAVSEGGKTLQKSFAYVDSTGFKSSETVYGVTTTFSSDSFGNVDQITDASGKSTSFSYEWGVLKNRTTSAYTIQRSIVASGLVTSVLRRGLTTTFSYDTLFRITTIHPPLGADFAYSFDNTQGRWMQLTRGVSNQRTDLDGFGRPSATSNAVSVKTDMAYDACGRMTYQSYPFTGTSNIGTSFQYDPLGRVTRRTHPDSATISYDYDGIDVTITNERGLDSTQDWEAYGDPGDAVLAGVIDRDNQTWSYNYDVAGNLTLVNSPGTTANRTWTYNTKNQLTSETHPESGTASYTYFANGKLQTKTDPAFGTTAYAYDGNNRLVLIDWPGPGSTALGYDDSDNRTLLENESIRSTFGYDGANRMISRQDLHKGDLSTWTAGFAYDTRDNLTRITYPTQAGGRLSVDYTYDNGNRISRIAEFGGTNEVFADSFAYHPSGGVLQYVAGNGITHKFEYHPSRYWVDDVYDLGGPEQVLDLAYVYDAAGNVESIGDSRPGMSQQFTYDNLDRLATASGPWGGHDYGYDSEGNITAITRTGGGGPSTTFQYSAATRRLTQTTGGGAAAFGYDANGNMRTAGSDAFLYTPQNMMSSSTVSGVSAAYGYDGDNLRKLKAGGSATRQYFHGPGDLLLSEFETSCGYVRAPVRDYVYAGSRLVASMKHNLDPPVPTSPGPATNDPTPTFQWDPVLGATNYRLILKNQTGQTLLDKTNISSESFVSTVTLSEGSYRWQIQARNATVQSCFSAESDFEVDLSPPSPVTNLVLSAPSGGALNLTWTATGDNGLSGTAYAYDVRYGVGSALDYPTAIQATNEPAPAASGTVQTFLLTGLSNETVYSVALTVVDDAENASAVSNVATRATFDVSPPEAIGDLAASNPTLDSIRLQWTAPHEDGSLGAGASVYDMRRSTSPITGANFQAAVPVAGAPAPAAPGVVQSMTVGGLLHTTRYYFAIKSIDFDGNLSPISNVASIDTLDGTPPSAVTNLTALADTTQQESVVTAVAASGEEGTSTKAKAVDGVATTYWSTPGRTAMQDEYITLDTGALRLIGRVQLLSPSSGFLFPEDLRVEVSDDNLSFLPVAERTGLPATQAIWHTIDFAPSQGRYVRIYITKTRLSGGGLYYARIAEIDVFETTIIAGAIELAWTAPGDDGALGTATAYDLRYGTSPITDANFESELPIATGSPLTGGSAETVTVMGLSDETRFYFALKTSDDRANVSSLSNVAVADTLGTPPAPVTDLLASNPTVSSIRLSWTATGDDGTSGTASSYDLRYSTAPITAASFSQAVQVAGLPAPLASGAAESFTVGSLSGGTTYYFAIKVADELGNSSTLNANGPVTSTTLDGIAPSAVTDLAATFAGGGPLIEVAAPAIAASGEEGSATKAKATDNVVTSYWSSPGRSAMQDEFITFDTGAVRSVGRVKLLSPSSGALFPEDLRVELSHDNVSFLTVAERTGLPSTQGLWHTIDFPVSSGRYVRIYITKTRISGGGLYYARIAEVDVFESAVGPTDVYVTWTAPGDDGMAGTASSYDLRYSTTPIDSAPEFEAATPVTGEPVPSVSGTSESLTVSNAPQGVLLHFALRTSDESGNVSALSNVASVQTGFPDATAPSAIEDLTAVLETVQQEVMLTAVAASGEEGTSTKEKALDGVTTSFWSTPGRTTMQDEYITLDTGAVRSIGRVRLLSPSSGFLFPEDLRVELSSDNVSFTTAATRTGLPSTQAVWHTIDFGPSPGRYVRIYITKTRLSGGGLYYARIAEIEAFETTFTGAVELSWTAPGDDGSVGIAASYDVRRSGSAIATEAAFQSATAVSGTPAPQGAGAQQSFLVNGLGAGTYHFAIKTTDDAGNSSALSNNASVTIP